MAIVGRPNVGKSTLFNRLVGKRLGLVDDQPGVTRDLREGAARLGPLRITAIDTAGLEDAKGDELPARMRRLTERPVEMVDICLFVIDARAGVTPADEIFAEILRKRAKHVLLAANKCEGRAADPGIAEAYGLGLGDPIPLSAEHGQGLEDLYSALEPIVAELEADADRAQVELGDAEEAVSEVSIMGELSDEEAELANQEAIDPSKPIRLAVLGRPNAGKSTLVNAILGEDRLLTGPEAGITRDAIGLNLDWNGRPFKIFDTAGLRKRAKVENKIEKLSTHDGIRAAKFAEVVVLLLDARTSFESQDLRIADLVAREGRAIVIGLNKWDLIEDKPKALAAAKETFERLLPQLRGAPLVTLSAETGKGLGRLREAAHSAHAAWNIRVGTSRLNRWLMHQVERHPPPAPSGRRLRLRYMTQAKTRPPTFVLFASRPDALPESYTRFLTNGLRETFDMQGTPIRVIVKAGDNPYAGKARKR